MNIPVHQYLRCRRYAHGYLHCARSAHSWSRPAARQMELVAWKGRTGAATSCIYGGRKGYVIAITNGGTPSRYNIFHTSTTIDSRAIPVGSFVKDWELGQVGESIKKYAPQAFASEK